MFSYSLASPNGKNPLHFFLNIHNQFSVLENKWYAEGKRFPSILKCPALDKPKEQDEKNTKKNKRLTYIVYSVWDLFLKQ